MRLEEGLIGEDGVFTYTTMFLIRGSLPYLLDQKTGSRPGTPQGAATTPPTMFQSSP